MRPSHDAVQKKISNGSNARPPELDDRRGTLVSWKIDENASRRWRLCNHDGPSRSSRPGAFAATPRRAAPARRPAHPPPLPGRPPRFAMKSAKDLLEDVPLPKANDLFLATAAATLGSGLLTVAKPEKMHDAYFTESDDDGATQVMHKPSTRWLGMSLCWVGAWNVAAALAPEGNAKAKETPARQRRGPSLVRRRDDARSRSRRHDHDGSRRSRSSARFRRLDAGRRPRRVIRGTTAMR